MRGRGCVLMLAITATPVFASPSYDTISGQVVTLEEVLLDENPGQLWVRFRFLAPAIAADAVRMDPDVAATDMQGLCDEVAVPYVQTYELAPERVVISLADRVVPFGQTDAEATQFFELYSLQDGLCIWEEF